MADPTVTHSTAADATFSATGATAWNADHTITGLLNADSPTFAGLTLTGLSSGSVAIVGTGGVIEYNAGFLFNTTDWIVLQRSSGETGSTRNITVKNQSGTAVFYVQPGNATTVVSTGPISAGTGTYGSTMSLGSAWATIGAVGTGAPSAFIFGATAAASGGATTRLVINKAVASIADNTATATFTVTIPNAAHSASIRVRLTGSMGAGGAIGANESTQDAEYMINVARTAGVNAVATIGAVVGQAAAAAVAGAGTVAVTGALSAIAGAVGATNTFTINVTIARSGGSSTNHTCFAFAELLNANASGVTIA